MSQEPKSKGLGLAPMRNKPDMTETQDLRCCNILLRSGLGLGDLEALPHPLAHHPSTRAAFFTISQSLTGAVCKHMFAFTLLFRDEQGGSCPQAKPSRDY